MFQFRRFPAYAYLIQRTLTEYCSAGFPHSEIRGLTPMCGSPRLIAACHVLLRLLMPRHSPCALYSLTWRCASAHLLVLTRIMQASDLVHCSICVTLFKSPQIKTLLPLCCLLAISCLLHCSVFKVQSPTFFKVRLKCSDSCPNTSIQSCGGGYRIRTGDPLLAKQVLYQLS